MADNFVCNVGSGGLTFISFAEAGGTEHPGTVPEYVTGGSANAWTFQKVQLTTGLPVQPQTGSTWPVSIAASVAVTGTFWQATQPISAASLPLPTGASTAAKQPALGTAGSASADVLTIQGIASMTAVKVDGSAVTQPVSGTFWQATQPISGAVSQTAGPWTINLTTVAGSAISLGHGTAASAIRVELPSDGTGTLATVTTVSTVAAVTAITNALPAGTNLLGHIVSDVATTGGSTPHHLVSAASNNATSLKASAGQVYGVQAYNVNASPRYLKLYNKASAPAPASDTPVKTLLIPGATAGAGLNLSWNPGVIFTTGIAYAIVANMSDTDNTSVGAGDCVINIDYN